MPKSRPPSLRNGAHLVTLVESDDGTRAELGKRHPEEAARRCELVRQWGGAMASPRAERQAAIEEPLCQREQTILSYQVNPGLRAMLNRGGAPMSSSRKEGPAGDGAPITLNRSECGE